MTSAIRSLWLLPVLSWSAVTMATEEPDYTVLESRAGYELRNYSPYLVAEVDVSGTRAEAGNEAFRILAGYIFGDNVPRERMNMTAPVESAPARGARMKMTAPVEARPGSQPQALTYSFVMERRYTIATLPQPVDERIRIVERAPRLMAVRRYSGRWSEETDGEQQKVLLAALDRDGVTIRGEPVIARYDSPFTPGFLRRNEVMIEIEPPAKRQ